MVVARDRNLEDFQYFWYFCTDSYQGKLSIATKHYGFQSALKYLSYEPNIKALSQLEAEIQSIARVVAREWNLEDLTEISFCSIILKPKKPF